MRLMRSASMVRVSCVCSWPNSPQFSHGTASRARKACRRPHHTERARVSQAHTAVRQPWLLQAGLACGARIAPCALGAGCAVRCLFFDSYQRFIHRHWSPFSVLYPSPPQAALRCAAMARLLRGRGVEMSGGMPLMAARVSTRVTLRAASSLSSWG